MKDAEAAHSRNLCERSPSVLALLMPFSMALLNKRSLYNSRTQEREVLNVSRSRAKETKEQEDKEEGEREECDPF